MYIMLIYFYNLDKIAMQLNVVPFILIYDAVKLVHRPVCDHTTDPGQTDWYITYTNQCLIEPVIAG